MFWKYVERICSVLGLLFTAAILYYTVATYYGWNQSPAPAVPTMNAPWWIFAGGGIGVTLLITAWVMISIRLASERDKGKTGSNQDESRQQSSATARLPTAPVEPPRRNVLSVDLNLSGNDLLCLVVTAARGGVRVGTFLDWSAWHDAATFHGAGAIHAGWSTPQRFFLRDLNLRADGLKHTVEVLERFPFGDDQTAWRWKILTADGNPATTLPMSTSTKERVTFTFIDQDGKSEHFKFLFVRQNADFSTLPIILTEDDIKYPTV
jgi:hypothetical protein